jgi:hypothetical protein
MDGEELFLMLVMTGVSAVLLFPIVRAVAERIRPRHQEPDATARALADLRDSVLDELHAVRREVTELGERVDFTERLLAKQQDAARLERPHPTV